jgi:hypothetical protein
MEISVINMSTTARNYLNELIAIIQNNSINKKTIDCLSFRAEVFDEVNQAQTIQDAYPGILKALELLGDNHSFFRTAIG